MARALVPGIQPARALVLMVGLELELELGLGLVLIVVVLVAVFLIWTTFLSGPQDQLLLAVPHPVVPRPVVLRLGSRV
ncbi:hypothetical protein NHF46_09160 [Arthrobacter alpinus]|nr:hypothetical protein [Arthrobacter alpinus]